MTHEPDVVYVVFISASPTAVWDALSRSIDVWTPGARVEDAMAPHRLSATGSRSLVTFDVEWVAGATRLALTHAWEVTLTGLKQTLEREQPLAFISDTRDGSGRGATPSDGPLEYEVRDVEVTTGEGIAICRSLCRVSGATWIRQTVYFHAVNGEWIVTRSEGVPVSSAVDVNP
jgi:hypothetical protein